MLGPPMLAHGAVDAGLFTIALVAGLLAATLAYQRISDRNRPLFAVAAGGLGFQVVHAAEHVVQVSYWIARPTAPPWLSPWAEVGAHGLAALADGRQATGEELLHLVGNLIFLSGVIAALRLAVRLNRSGTGRLRFALWLQTFHVAEHVLLTTTWLATGRALGITTAFGALAASPVTAVAVRVWAHLILNLTATVPALLGALLAWRRDGSHLQTGVTADSGTVPAATPASADRTYPEATTTRLSPRP